MGTAATTRSPKDAARHLRIEHWNDGGKIKFPVDPFAIARSLGIEVHDELLDPDTAGFIIREHGGRVNVYLNVLDSYPRRRFTMAHELGHFIQHQGDSDIGFVDRRDELSAAGTDPHEIWANRFAAELLMPAAVVSKWWAEGKTPDEIRKKLQVSAAALAFRMDNLGLLNG